MKTPFKLISTASALLLFALILPGKAQANYGDAPNLRIHHQFDNTKTEVRFHDDQGQSHKPKVPGDHHIYLKNALGKDMNFKIRRDGGKLSLIFHVDGPDSPIAYLSIKKPGGGSFSYDGVTYTDIPVHPAHQLYLYSELEQGASGRKIKVLNDYGNPAWTMSSGQDFHWRVQPNQEMRFETVKGEAKGPEATFGQYGFFSVNLKKYPGTPSGQKSSLRFWGKNGITTLDVYPGTEVYIKGKPQQETPSIPLRVYATKSVLNNGEVSFVLRAYQSSPGQVYTNPEYHYFTNIKLVRGDVVQEEYEMNEEATEITIRTGPNAATKYSKTGQWNSQTAIQADEYRFFNMGSDEVRLGLIGESPGGLGLQIGQAGPTPPTTVDVVAINPCVLQPDLCPPDDDGNAGDGPDADEPGVPGLDPADDDNAGKDGNGGSNKGVGSEEGLNGNSGNAGASGSGCSLARTPASNGAFGILGWVLWFAPLGLRKIRASRS